MHFRLREYAAGALTPAASAIASIRHTRTRVSQCFRIKPAAFSDLETPVSIGYNVSNGRSVYGLHEVPWVPHRQCLGHGQRRHQPYSVYSVLGVRFVRAAREERASNDFSQVEPLASFLRVFELSVVPKKPR